MAIDRMSGRSSARASAALLIATASLAALIGCTRESYMGISFAAGANDPQLQELARRAARGEERAQLELGIRFEEGHGVPVDLSRAEELYSDAATRPSRRRAAIYLPGRRRGQAGSVRLLPAAAEYSGLKEALIRWHRLSGAPGGTIAADTGRDREPARERADGTDRRGSVGEGRALETRTLFEDPADLAAAEEQAAIQFGSHPVFQGLKAGGSDPRAMIADGDPITVISEFTVGQSLALLARRFGQEHVEALCAALIRQPPDDSASLRLFGLCTARQPRAAPAVFGAAAEHASRALSAASGSFDARYLHAAGDIAYLFRIANLVGRSEDADRLYMLLDPVAEGLERVERDCEADRCPSEQSYVLRRADFLRTQLMLAVLERPGLLRRPGALAAERISALAAPVALDVPFSGQREENACALFGLPADECRRRYPYEPALDQYVARIIAHYATRRAPDPAAACVRLRERHGELSSELAQRRDLDGLLIQFLESECLATSQRNGA